MASSLYNQSMSHQGMQPNQNQMKQQVQQLINAGNSGNGPAIFNKFMQENPQFQQFMQQHQGKSIDQVVQELGGMNFGQFQQQVQNLIQ